MGTYRLILAGLVLYSHAFGAMFGLAPAVVAVISFFVISGYVMSLLIERTYPRLKDIPAFYLDRSARLFPQYLFYVILTLVAAQVLGFTDPTLSDRGFFYVLANLTMLPIGFYMFGLQTALYIPPAWSLGLEFTFYLAFPFFWLLPKACKYAVLAVSIAVFAWAFTGRINSDWFGYRILPGVFFIFVAGAGIAHPKAVGKYYSIGVAVLMAVAFLAHYAMPSISAIAYHPYNFDVAIGTVIGVTAVSVLRKFKSGKVDKYLGDLSYGVFLSHYLMIFIADRFGLSRWAIVPAGALVCAAISYEIIEKPALHARQAMRNRMRLRMAVA